MQTDTLVRPWAGAAEIALEITGGNELSVADVVGEIGYILDDLVPHYDKLHSCNTIELALRSKMGTCIMKAYMSHLIAQECPGIQSGIHFRQRTTTSPSLHAMCYLNDGRSVACLNDNSFYLIEAEEKDPFAQELLDTGNIPDDETVVMWVDDEDQIFSADSLRDPRVPQITRYSDELLLLGDTATRCAQEMFAIFSAYRNGEISSPAASMLGNESIPRILALNPLFAEKPSWET